MDGDAETLCELFVRERADVAGEVVVETSDLVLSAADDDSPMRAVAESKEKLTRRVYREDVTEIVDCIETTAEGGDPTETTVRVQLSADEWCLFEFAIYPAGHFTAETGPIFTGKNVTHEHFAAQRREVITRVLRHNLRNDMEIVSGYLEIIRQQCEHADQSAIDEVASVADKLLSLGEKMREIDARLTDSNNRLRRVNLRETTARVVEEYHAAHPAVTFRVNVGDDVIAGNSLVRDAIAELIENAIEHTTADDEETVITITTEERAEGSKIDLTVVDNGQGIPQGEADAISEATESKLNHSSGVGLWLVKWITDSINATFDITQRTDTHGTRATLGFRAAEGLDDSDQGFAKLQQRTIIRSELPDTDSADIVTSTRG
jgi:signal transduction histidine kinase